MHPSRSQNTSKIAERCIHAFGFCLGLVHEDCLVKMRLMSLVDLASSESGQIPYALIKDTLRVSCFPVYYAFSSLGFTSIN